MNKKSLKKGFSLMELIIVIIIIGILISAIVGLSNLKNIAKASLIYEQRLKIKKNIDVSMKESGEIFYRNFLTNDNNVARENVKNINNFNDQNPFGNLWYWEGEDPSATGGMYSDKLIIKTNVPQDLCPDIALRFEKVATTVSCNTSVSGANVKMNNFDELVIIFEGK